MLQRTAPRFGLSAALLCLSALLFSAAAPLRPHRWKARTTS